MQTDQSKTKGLAAAVLQRLVRRLRCAIGMHDWQGEDSPPGYPTRICANCRDRQEYQLVDWGRQKMWVCITPRKPSKVIQAFKRWRRKPYKRALCEAFSDGKINSIQLHELAARLDDA